MILIGMVAFVISLMLAFFNMGMEKYEFAIIFFIIAAIIQSSVNHTCLYDLIEKRKKEVGEYKWKN
jgi:uncharacterized membrane protein YtjA (UPF0391 family)